MTGKSFLLHKLFPNSPYYDLLRAETFLKLSMRPQALREELEESGSRRALRGPVVIDEIQKLPLLLDEVHSIIEDLKLQFTLTGSSARKIKRRGSNLLGGRAWTRRLHPLCSAEIGDYNVQRIFHYGSLPVMYDSEYPEEDLKAYCGTYLQQEIAEEGAARKIDAFSRFLRTALYNGEQVNYEAWGKAMEHFVYIELRSWLDYSNDVRDLSFWRTRDNREVDYIIGDDTAIEVKASSNPTKAQRSGDLASEGLSSAPLGGGVLIRLRFFS